MVGPKEGLRARWNFVFYLSRILNVFRRKLIPFNIG